MLLKVRSLESVRFLSYLHFCNVLYIWSVWVIPTYRVYQLYDKIILVCPSVGLLRKVSGNDLTSRYKMQYLWLPTERG